MTPFQGHASGPPLQQAANIHVMGAISNGGDLFEMLVPEEINETAMKDYITLDKDGSVSIPKKPGLGLEIDWEQISKFTTAVVE